LKTEIIDGIGLNFKNYSFWNIIMVKQEEEQTKKEKYIATSSNFPLK
jgi:hypothetical protein